MLEAFFKCPVVLGSLFALRLSGLIRIFLCRERLLGSGLHRSSLVLAGFTGGPHSVSCWGSVLLSWLISPERNLISCLGVEQSGGGELTIREVDVPTRLRADGSSCCVCCPCVRLGHSSCEQTPGCCPGLTLGHFPVVGEKYFHHRVNLLSFFDICNITPNWLWRRVRGHFYNLSHGMSSFPRRHTLELLVSLHESRWRVLPSSRKWHDLILGSVLVWNVTAARNQLTYWRVLCSHPVPAPLTSTRPPREPMLCAGESPPVAFDSPKLSYCCLPYVTV